MKAHLIDTHLLVPRPRSSAKVKVKYQGHVSQRCFGGIRISQTHLVTPCLVPFRGLLIFILTGIIPLLPLSTFYTPTNEVGGGYTGVALSVRLYVRSYIRLCITKSCPGNNFKIIKASNFKLHTQIGHILEKCSV